MFLKSKYFIIALVVGILSLIPIFIAKSKDENILNGSKFQNIQKILRQQATEDADSTNTIENLLENFNSQTGTWADIDYTDKSRTSWDPINHLKRIKSLSINYNQGQKDKTLLTIIDAALKNWFKRDYTCPNWFLNDITAKQYLIDILILVGKDINQENYNYIIQKLDAIYPKDKTGVNRIWLASIQLKYGLYIQNTELINSAISYISNEIYISNNDEGIQADYSYRFHKARIQEYAYGIGILESSVEAFNLVKGTDFEFSKDKIKIIRDFILESWQWLARGSYTVPSSIDRSSSWRGGLKSPEAITTLEMMKLVDTLFATQYQNIINQQKDIQQFALDGVKAFPYSDIAVAHSKNTSFFIKVLSDRNLPTESINSENLKGKYLHFGNHFILKDAKEYTNILAAFDWNLLPGFSYIEGTDTILRTSNTGVAAFGNTIVADMTFDYIGTSKQKITRLNKTWILQKDRIICLIAAPETPIEKPIITSLNQTRFRNNTYINNQKIAQNNGTFNLKKDDILWHDKLLYYSPKAEAIQVKLEEKANDWKSINLRYKKEKKIDSIPIFLATIQQNNNPIDYSISYLGDPKSILNNQVYVVTQNNNDAQLVYLKNENTYCGTIFNPNKELKIPSIKNPIRVDKPILFMYKNNTIFVTEPSFTSSAITLKIKRKTYKIVLDKKGQGNIKIK